MLRLTASTMTWVAAGALAALPALALPADEHRQDIPITDPVLLETLGFPPDASDVYATPRALQELLLDPAERAAAVEALLETRLTGEAGSSFGPTVGHTSLGAYAFRPGKSRYGYTPRTTAYSEMVCADLSVSNDTPRYIAEFEALPHGAELKYVGVWVRDSHASENVTASLYRTCFIDGTPSAGINTLLGQASSTGSFGHQILDIGATGLDETIDTHNCVYRLWADLGSAGTCDPNNLGIHKATARWARQVSPPPPTATFDDVPTTHLFFRHIEALAASQITAGCDADSYCPNAPLTRGQMAVFLATALGLHWGN